MQIFVKDPSGRSTAYTVSKDASVEGFNAQVENQTFLPADLVRFVCESKQLTTGSLADFGVEEGVTISMLLHVNGGMRAKWRKKRMRRLRRKRRKMRQRAR
uniref:60S ribosomal protein L41 n=1 Tax=Heterosigma akashiwo TaxID=2829 RepID=A0A7S4DB66_HETAK|mmetsp:Transcript_42722/g.56400  ORF Transcript_42722/g.56400 Transcript_42722/m.56400 type:complete len:101 (+) Transcript_42722:63-365(+)